jgi:hypothetical protein
MIDHRVARQARLRTPGCSHPRRSIAYAKTKSPLSLPLGKESKNEQFYLPFSMPRGQGYSITT